MKTILAWALLAFTVLPDVVAQGDFTFEEEIRQYQDTLNSEFRDPETSPLLPKDLQKFEGLDFFNIDEKYRVMAKFIRITDAKPFKMKTTTQRRPVYQKYAKVVFELKGQEQELYLYQGFDVIKQAEYKDYLFLPFLDDTNGSETYGGGRYIGLYIPKGDSIEIDFNKAYNPYCVYNTKYSCPIVPRANRLKMRVEAGVMTLNKD